MTESDVGEYKCNIQNNRGEIVKMINVTKKGYHFILERFRVFIFNLFLTLDILNDNKKKNEEEKQENNEIKIKKKKKDSIDKKENCEEVKDILLKNASNEDVPKANKVNNDEKAVKKDEKKAVKKVVKKKTTDSEKKAAEDNKPEFLKKKLGGIKNQAKKPEVTETGWGVKLKKSAPTKKTDNVEETAFNLKPVKRGSEPVFTDKIKGISTNVGKSAEFTARVSGTEPYKCEWFLDNKKIETEGSDNIKISISAKEVRLKIISVTTEDAGRYLLVVSNDYGKCECSTTLVVKGLENLIYYRIISLNTIRYISFPDVPERKSQFDKRKSTDRGKRKYLLLNLFLYKL